jgi:hypothetical protein
MAPAYSINMIVSKYFWVSLACDGKHVLLRLQTELFSSKERSDFRSEAFPKIVTLDKMSLKCIYFVSLV